MTYIEGVRTTSHRPRMDAQIGAMHASRPLRERWRDVSLPCSQRAFKDCTSLVTIVGGHNVTAMGAVRATYHRPRVDAQTGAMHDFATMCTRA